MKKIILGFTAIFALLLLANCVTQNKVSPNLKREWMLVEFQNFSKEILVSNKANINFSNLNDGGKFSAKMGCNNLFGTATLNSNESVKFSQIGSTMMFCDQAMDLETAFNKALPMMKNYKIEGHYLTLSDSKGNLMKFVASDWD